MFVFCLFCFVITMSIYVYVFCALSLYVELLILCEKANKHFVKGLDSLGLNQNGYMQTLLPSVQKITHFWLKDCDPYCKLSHRKTCNSFTQAYTVYIVTLWAALCRIFLNFSLSDVTLGPFHCYFNTITGLIVTIVRGKKGKFH